MTGTALPVDRTEAKTASGPAISTMLLLALARDLGCLSHGTVTLRDGRAQMKAQADAQKRKS